MKLLNKNICIALLSATMFGCGDDFLDRPPISSMNEEIFYRTVEDFQLAVNASYSTLHTIYAPESGVSYAGEQMSDNATLYHVAGNTAERWAFKDYNLRSDNQVVDRIWTDYYTSLFRINTVLAKLEGAAIDSNVKQQFQGEMKFLRGLYYFNMVQLFGPVPLLSRPVTVMESYGVLRSPVNEVYAFIVEDLKYAESVLKVRSQTTRVGQASKGAAQGLLGKVYLTMGDKASAAESLMKVVTSNEYMLLPSYGMLWQLNNKNSKEALFEIQYKGGATNPSSPYWAAFAPSENFTVTTRGGGMNQVTDDLWNEYEPNDARRDLSIFEGYQNRTGGWVPIKFPKKWVDRNAPVVSQQERSDNNFIVLRYADILLLLSEATQDPQYLNQVRKRAGMPEFGTAGYPSALYPTLPIAIEHERRVELALEFHRWFDLKRTNRAITVLTAKGKSVTPNKLLLPIPQSVIDQNPSLNQNQGY